MGALVADDNAVCLMVAAIVGAAIGVLTLWTLALAVAYWQAPSAQLRAAREHIGAAANRLVPRLSFGPAEIPREPHQLPVRMGGRATRKGRIISVSVTNAPGAEDARRVHARLRFPPNSPLADTHSPGATQGEWASDGDAPEIDIAGNGRSHHLAVVVVVDQRYPHTFEWTERSRTAGLTGYEISDEPVDIEIAVANGDIEPLVGTLRIDCSGGTICADWTNAGPDAPSNCVPWHIPPTIRVWQ